MGAGKEGFKYQTRGKPDKARLEMREGQPVSPEQLHCSLRVLHEFIQEEMEKAPMTEAPKISIAWLKGDSWVASVVWWPKRLQVTAFSYEPAKALYKLAERICDGGEVWRAMQAKEGS